MAGERLRVCTLDDLPPGDRLLVDVDDQSVCVLNIDGDVYAIEHECAHRGGPICRGDIDRSVDEVVERGVEREARVDGEESDTLVVTCPWHGWRYDLANGDHLGATDASLWTPAVVVENEVVYLDVDD